MSLTATSHSIAGTLMQEIVIDGTHRLRTDEPVRLGGDGNAPAPHELVPAAIASCVGTSLVMYARTKGWQLGDISVDVDFENRATPRHFDITITVGADVTDDQLERLERVARACPVRRSFEVGAEFSERVIRSAPAAAGSQAA